MASGLIPGLTAINNQLIAPPGTRMCFHQAAPPLGWTQDTSASFNDTSMRLVTGAGGSSGGSTTWSTWNFGGTFNVNTFTISSAQLPGHTHNGSGSGTTGTSNQSLNHSHNIPTASGSGGGQPQPGAANNNNASTDAVDLSGHNHNLSYSFTTDGGNGLFYSGIQPNYTTPQVKYSDWIIGIKS